MSLQNFNGYQVFLDIRLTVPREIQVKRTWFERLFSFSPLVKTKSKWIDVPSMEIILINNKMIMHPEAFKELKRRIVKNNGQMTFPRNKGKWKFDVVDVQRRENHETCISDQI